jgi:hypothetical protein
MITNKKNLLVMLFAISVVVFGSCVKEKYSFGDIKTPSALTINTEITGTDAANPDGDGSGGVAISATATDVITYKVDFGDGTTKMVPSGSIAYKYTKPGTADYTITVNAIGTAGTISSISKKIRVYVAFVIPDEIVQDLTGGTSKVWMTANETPGHVGVGPADGFTPSYYSAAPNERSPCLYDDEMTFTKDANGNISLSVNNKGESFLIGASTAFYGKSGGDGCYSIAFSNPMQLTFMNATSGSTSANSTGIQFKVPGNGLINFGTGGDLYEILAISETSIQLRNIGIDGNSWYQIFKVK